MVLAARFIRDCESPFAAYMALQRCLLNRWLARGGSAEDWCARIAPRFRLRYEGLFSAGQAPLSPPVPRRPRR